MSEVMPTMEVMPMTTPSTVSPERILLVRRVSIDITTISDSSPLRSAAIIPASLLESALLAPEGLDRVELRRPHRRIEAEEETNHRRDADTGHDRPHLHGGGQWRQLADDLREDKSEQRAHDAAEG